jgi:hypothetical protein
VAHLAGALGKKVYLLLHSEADWRWLRDREDSPWYPTMNLLRQSRAGDWNPVVTSLGNLLMKMTRDDQKGKIDLSIPGAHPADSSATNEKRGRVDRQSIAG